MNEQELAAVERHTTTLVVTGVIKAIRAMLTASGWTGRGWLTSRLVGELWVHGTLVVTPDDLALGSDSRAVPYSQAHTVLTVNGLLRTAATGSAVSVRVDRLRNSATTALGTLTFAVGARTARLATVTDSVGLAGDYYKATVTAEDSGGDADAESITLDVRVDVIRGAG